MKALVVGGTGPTGPLVVAGLIERGYDVAILHTGKHEVARQYSEHLCGSKFHPGIWFWQVLFENILKLEAAEQMVDQWQRSDKFGFQIESASGHRVTFGG